MARRSSIHDFSLARARRANKMYRMNAEQKKQWMQEQLGSRYSRNAKGLVVK